MRGPQLRGGQDREPRRVVARRRKTRAKGKANGSRTSTRRVDCETSAATFKSCSRNGSNCARPSWGASGAHLGPQRVEEHIGGSVFE